MQKESKIKPEFSSLSQTINILGSELGNVIKQQAGKSKFELVEEIRVNSKKYSSSKYSKFLLSVLNRNAPTGVGCNGLCSVIVLILRVHQMQSRNNFYQMLDHQSQLRFLLWRVLRTELHCHRYRQHTMLLLN